MPDIPNFPAHLLHEHHQWHTGGRRPPALNPGAGLDFLMFHRNYVQKALAWYNAQPGADPAAVTPWTSIPPELKRSVLGWNSGLASDESRIENDKRSFPSEDVLGRFIEFGEFGGNNIHGWLHGAAASHYAEPILTSFDSPRSTYFYKLHGLVDHWWQQYVKDRGFGQIWDGRPFWIGNFDGLNQSDVLFYYPGDQNWWLGSHDGQKLQWTFVGNTHGFGQVWDGRPFWTGNFSRADRQEVLFYYPGDQNWWLGSHDGNQLQWSLAGNTAGFGQVWDGRPIWTGSFSRVDRQEVLFYFPGDSNWWLGSYDGNQLQWSLVGNTGW